MRCVICLLRPASKEEQQIVKLVLLAFMLSVLRILSFFILSADVDNLTGQCQNVVVRPKFQWELTSSHRTRSNKIVSETSVLLNQKSGPIFQDHELQIFRQNWNHSSNASLSRRSVQSIKRN